MDPSSKNVENTGGTIRKYILLCISCILVISNYFAFYTPVSLQTEVMAHYGVAQEDYVILFSIYSLPNIILVLVSGLIVDYLGYKISHLIFGLCLPITLGLSYLSSLTNSFPLLLFARFIHGIGGEGLYVAQMTAISSWFSAEQRSKPMILLRVFCQIGTALANFGQPRIFAYTKTITTPYLVSFGLTLIGYFSSILYALYESKLIKDGFIAKSTSQRNTKNLNPRKVLEFSNIFWILICLMFILMMVVVSFGSIMSDYLQQRFTLSEIEAGDILAIQGICSLIYLPFVGLIIGKYLTYSSAMVLGSIGLIMGYVFSALLTNTPDSKFGMIAAILFTGLSSTFLMTSFYPSLSMSIDEESRGIAFGMATATQNLGMTIGPYLFAKFIQMNSMTVGEKIIRREAYVSGTWLLILVAVIASFCTILHHLKAKSGAIKTEDESAEQKKDTKID